MYDIYLFIARYVSRNLNRAPLMLPLKALHTWQSNWLKQVDYVLSGEPSLYVHLVIPEIDKESLA